jgi:hypothetical protein
MALHHILVSLGFSTQKHIIFVVSEEMVAVLLRAQDKDVPMRTGAPELPLDQMVERWGNLLTEWNTGGGFSAQEKQALLEGSQVYAKQVDLMLTILSKGIDFPKHM